MRYLLVIGCCWMLTPTAFANAYLILYATHEGKTGHCGIAVDEYKIHVREEDHKDGLRYFYDTVATGALIYYDFWPAHDDYKEHYDTDTEPAYFKLPSAKWKQIISLRTLQDQGIPHKYGYPCDAILEFSSSKSNDFALTAYLDQKMRNSRPFNAMEYNCCDFVGEALTFYTGRSCHGKEFVVKGWVTTPNALYREIASWPDVMIIRDPGAKVSQSFFRERIAGRLIPSFTDFQYFLISHRL